MGSGAVQVFGQGPEFLRALLHVPNRVVALPADEAADALSAGTLAQVVSKTAPVVVVNGQSGPVIPAAIRVPRVTARFTFAALLREHPPKIRKSNPVVGPEPLVKDLLGAFHATCGSTFRSAWAAVASRLVAGLVVFLISFDSVLGAYVHKQNTIIAGILQETRGYMV